ncbi:MAG: isoprenylcysteine carboxylmethyltransferase family protein [Bacteroidota bacterium]
MLTKFGNWIFHYRNFLFPLFYLTLFIPSPDIFGNVKTALILGGVIIFLGVFTRSATIGLVYIVRGGKNRRIHANNLVTEGIYSVCRNPMYLGNILLILGFAVFSNSLLFLLVMFPFFVFIYVAIIKAEEAFLIGKFGDEYREYKKTTYAIIPKLMGVGKLFKEYKFNFTRVVIREYNSLFIYFTGILLILLYKELINLKLFAIIFAAVLVVYLVIKVLKKKGILVAK